MVGLSFISTRWLLDDALQQFCSYITTSWQIVLQMHKLDFCIVDNYTLSKVLWCNRKNIPGLWHFHHVCFLPVQIVTLRHWSFVSQKYLHCLSSNSLLAASWCTQVLTPLPDALGSLGTASDPTYVVALAFWSGFRPCELKIWTISRFLPESLREHFHVPRKSAKTTRWPLKFGPLSTWKCALIFPGKQSQQLAQL